MLVELSMTRCKTDVTVHRGATRPDVIWRMMSQGQPFPGEGSVFVMTIHTRNGKIVKTSDGQDGLTYDNTTGRLRWHRTLAESNQISYGRFDTYDITRMIGDDIEPIISGNVCGVGG